MSYLISIPSFSFLLLLLLTPVSAQPISKGCGKPSESTAAYVKNRDDVLENLRLHTTKTGFSNATSHQNGTVPIYGIALCRGDVPNEDCGKCLSAATNQTKADCNGSREGVIWYDYCSLKYSDENFVGSLDAHYSANLYSLKNATNAPLFYNSTRELLKGLSAIAIRRDARFASSDKTFKGAGKIYGMAQCTRDINPSVCEQCLEYAVSALPQPQVRADETVPDGARYLTPNCMVRYETYGFLLNPPTN